jgi:hypothetical protein
MKLTFTPNTHPDEDVFENYAFGRLSDCQVSDLENHVLVCEKCQCRLAETEEFILLMKSATAANREGGSPPGSSSGRHGLRWNAAAAALILLSCLTGLLSWRTPSEEPKTVVLDAYRGEAIQAPAEQPLELQIDLSDVPQAAAYRVEVVDAAGRRLWFGGTPARVSKGLSPGIYWVRLSTDLGEPLREYGLHATKSR